MSELDDLIGDFVVESRDGLDRLDQDLVALEREPDAHALLGDAFRALHTIKGACGFLGFARLERLAHAAESLLSRLRDGTLAHAPAMTTALLRAVDAARGMLSEIERTGQDGPDEPTELVAVLGALAAGSERAGVSAPQTPAPAATPGTPPNESTVRVDVDVLDGLMDLVGELVLARNQVLERTATREDPLLAATCQRLDHVTSELQERVMKTRMQPVGRAWSRFPRLARDLAQGCGKRVRIELEGEGTELDRTIVEAIKDPLTHALRNAIDHGIEAPEGRRAAGKPEEGVVRLRAYHEGGQVHVEVVDDGAGLDAERIRAKAIERGLVAPEQAARMTERDLVQLVFLPGFSTAARVTNLSGRGVGMDVVRANVEAVGGTVELDSVRGLGTSLRIRIPLTLAIVPALLVGAGGGRYAIPQVHLLELVRLEGERARRGIESVRGVPVHRLRGSLLPLVRLSETLGVPSCASDDVALLVVLQAEGRRFGLVVDDIHDVQEIVVKPLGSHLAGVEAFAGATILGDGRVALILDVQGLARLARVVDERGRRGSDAAAAPLAPHATLARRALLLVQVGESERAALPLESVVRLEEVAPSAIERSAGREVVQYAGGVLPLVRLADVLGRAPLARDADRPLSMVVVRAKERTIGLIVDRIVDAVDAELAAEEPTQHDARGRALAGSAVVQGRVTDLLDVEALACAARATVAA